MWLISARDLQFRLRRFVVAVAVTSLVFGIALVFDGVKRALGNEVPRIVASFHADEWIVADGASGPFTATRVVPVSAAEELRHSPGVRVADPVIIGRTVVATSPAKDVNLIGHVRRGLGAPTISEGRAIRGSGEVVVGASVDIEVGKQLDVGGRRLKVVGRTVDSRFYFGNPTVFVSLHDAQGLMFNGQPLAMAIPVQGRVESLPAGLTRQSVAHVEEDLRRPLKSGVDTIDFVNILLWLIAAGIIALVIYLSALERVRDFAVFKATGAPNRTIIGGLLLQATFLSLAAALLAIPVARVVSLGLPFPAEIETTSIVQLVAVSVVVGLLASIAGVRRALATDPALAFGGA